MMISIVLWLLFPLLARCTNGMNVQLKLAPLIGGPSFIPIHVKVIVAEDHIFDFVPLSAAHPHTIVDLLRFKPVPGEIRSMGRKQNQSPLVDRAEKFVIEYKDTNLHLLYNNCWTFALRLLCELKETQSDF
jgi:hypothetical protein